MARLNKPWLARTDRPNEYGAETGDDITEEFPERVAAIFLELDDSGISHLYDFITQGVIDQQTRKWMKLKKANQPIVQPILADVAARSVLYELLQERTLDKVLYGLIAYHTNAAGLAAAALFPEILLTGEPFPRPGKQLEILKLDIAWERYIQYMLPNSQADYPARDLVSNKSKYCLVAHLPIVLDPENLSWGIGRRGTGPGSPWGQKPGSGGGGSGGGWGGDPGSSGGGSGAGGSGGAGDTKVILPRDCPTPIFNKPYCSDAFSFDHFDLRGPIETVAAASGKFDPVYEELVSATLHFEGASYNGVEVTVGANSATEDYSQSGGNRGGILTIEDAANEIYQVPHTEESFGVKGLLEVFGEHYSGNVGVALQPKANDVTLTGQMSNFPILAGGNASCHNPPDATDPAWLKICVYNFVKKPLAGAACVTTLPLVIDFGAADGDPLRDEGCWRGGTRAYAPDGTLGGTHLYGTSVGLGRYGLRSSSALSNITFSVGNSLPAFGQAQGFVSNHTFAVYDGPQDSALLLGSTSLSITNGANGHNAFSVSIACNIPAGKLFDFRWSANSNHAFYRGSISGS